MGKTLEDLKKSREIRRDVLYKYDGKVPTSLWDISYCKDGVFEYEGRKQQVIAKKRHEKMDYDKGNPELSKAFSMSSQNVRGTSEDSGLSTFPPDLVKRVVNYYTAPNEIVLDPFAGHNSRMQVTYEQGRHYIGYDVSHKFMDFNREVMSQIMGEGDQSQLIKSNNTITLREQSSEHLEEKDNSVDLIFTSPPYYKIEYYTDEPEQLYFSKDYVTFLARMKNIIADCKRVLKPDKFIVFNINDFRYNKDFYTYHCDIVQIYRELGIRLWDIIIIKWPGAIGACFASQVEDRKVTAKSHEYLIVGKKETV
jgi:DNA modification methylase